jgi:hypothetical protein
MALLQSCDPPAYMNDFDGMPGMRLAWSDFVSGAFDAAIGVPLIPDPASCDGTHRPTA